MVEAFGEQVVGVARHVRAMEISDPNVDDPGREAASIVGGDGDVLLEVTERRVAQSHVGSSRLCRDAISSPAAQSRRSVRGRALVVCGWMTPRADGGAAFLPEQVSECSGRPKTVQPLGDHHLAADAAAFVTLRCSGPHAGEIAPSAPGSEAVGPQRIASVRHEPQRGHGPSLRDRRMPRPRHAGSRTGILAWCTSFDCRKTLTLDPMSDFKGCTEWPK